MQHVMDASNAQTADDGSGFYLQGLTLLRNGRADDAAAVLMRALRRQPDHAGMRRNLVRALLAAGRLEAVLPQAEAALALVPDDPELHFARGVALNATGQPTAACAAFHRALTLNPDHAPSWLNWGNASADLDDLEAAEALCRSALRLDPRLTEAHVSLGYVLTRQGRPAEAVAACEAAIALRPDFAMAQWNRAIALLTMGDLAAGFAAYEWRKRHPRFQHHFPPLAGPEWDGSDPAGRTILVRAEQGFGDTIQFARYLAGLVERGARPVIRCAPALTDLLAAMFGVCAIPGDSAHAASGDQVHAASGDQVHAASGDQVHAASGDAIPPAWDAWIDLLSLPHRMGTRVDTIPHAEGYLRADPARTARWTARFDGGQTPGAAGGWKIGLALRGNPATPRDRRRSLPADLTRMWPAIDGVRFVNLQHGPAAADLPLPDLTAEMPDFAATAALIASLDLVIAADTAVAHLAGAMGKPVWLLLPTDPDWRWMLDRADSPWYASMQLFRQTAGGGWQALLAQVFDALRCDNTLSSLRNGHGSPTNR